MKCVFIDFSTISFALVLKLLSLFNNLPPVERHRQAFPVCEEPVTDVQSRSWTSSGA